MFVSLSASKLICAVLRMRAECLSCVGITKKTKPSQFIERLKAKTVSWLE